MVKKVELLRVLKLFLMFFLKELVKICWVIFSQKIKHVPFLPFVLSFKHMLNLFIIFFISTQLNVCFIGFLSIESEKTSFICFI